MLTAAKEVGKVKKYMICLCAVLLCLLTGCGPKKDPAPPSVEQQLCTALRQCRDNAAKGMAQLQELDTVLLGGTLTQSGSYTLGVYQLQSNGQTLLLWQLDCAAQEERPGTLDTLRLSWQGAEYYLSDGDGVCSTVQGRTENSVAFNVQDNDLAAGESCFGVVYLKSAASGYDAHFTHTLQGERTTLTTVNGDTQTLTAVTTEVEQVVELRAAAE